MKLADLNESLPPDATRAEMLELQTYLIEHVDGSEDVEFEICRDHAYGLAIRLMHHNDECKVVIVKMLSGASNWGIRLTDPCRSFRMYYNLTSLVEGVHDWINGHLADWNRK